MKRKDAKIYNGTTSFFQEIEMGEKSSKKSDKPMTLVDLEREVITEKGGEFDELADEKLAQQLQDKTYVQEMSEIQKSLKSMVDEDQDDFLTKKVKNATEVEKDEEDYRSWLLGQKDHLQSSETESDLKTLKDYWTDKNLDSGEKFLRDYILNKRYLEGEEEEIEDAENLSDDEKTLEQQAEFEHKYNFRFEDPDKDFIKRYPRTIQDSMRRKDESRKQKREEVKERKQKEKEKKREELMQLKSLKRKEILEKIEKLRKITGNDELAFKDEDLEEDFDPEKYDQRMAEIFDQFDNAPIEAEDEEKPVFSDLDSDLEPENWDEYGDEMQGEINLDEENAEDENVEEGDNRKNLEKELIENSKG